MKTRGIARCSRNRSLAGRLAPIAAALVMISSVRPQVAPKGGEIAMETITLACEKCSLHEK